MTDNPFRLVGAQTEALAAPARRPRRLIGFPWPSALCFLLIFVGCLLAPLLTSRDPAYLDLAHTAQAPCRDFWFGTDELGRDIYAMIWYGGRISLFVGLSATALSTALAILFGTISGLAPRWLDTLMMRATEIFLSIPHLLLIVFLQALLGTPTPLSISLVIGLTGWPTMAKVVRTEVQQLRSSGYVVAARIMGGGTLYILRKHLLRHFIPSLLFMVVMDVRNAIAAESTLSFLGIGLPLTVISWGSMLSLAEDAILTNEWWILIIPGIFLIATLVSMTNVGHYIQNKNVR